MSKKIKVSVAGVTGYTGSETVRLLARRDDIELVELEGRSAAGQPLGKIFPYLAPLGLKVVEKLERPAEADFIFLGLPHHASAERAAELLEAAPNTRIIDLSADFRLRDIATYEKWYGQHHAPYLLPEAVYGLPELFRKQIKPTTRIIANPGCYPTAATLALAPALAQDIIEPEVVINALSGTSGAGRGMKQNLHYSEQHDSSSAYGLEGHRHAPEIVQNLEQVYRLGKVTVQFTPHLIPLSRGMLATCSAKLDPGWIATQGSDLNGAIRQLYQEFYAGEEFVRITDTPPTTKEVFGSNYCFVYPTVDANSGRLVSVAVIDNLVKGAAGQAIQNMNIMAGLPETTGLTALGIYP